MNSDSTISRARKVITPALHIYYPITIDSAEGIYIRSASGQEYLDFSSGLATLNIGHNHPLVIEMAREQLSRFTHTGGIYHNETTVTAAERLVSITPAGMDMVFFSNSGAEAVEGAMKLARFTTGRQGIISFTGGFHGRTLGALSVTTSSARYRKNYLPLVPSTFQAPYPSCFRCPCGRGPESCDRSCFSYLHYLLEHVIDPGDVAACIIEPVLGEGGYYPAPAFYLQKLREFCTDCGIMLIFDEVQSGMGRAGRWFASELSDVVPDIMTVAKGIASGFPLSAVVSTPQIMNRWTMGAHGTTFGGNPVSCAASLATIEAITREGLLEASSDIGKLALDRLNDISRRHRSIGDVRGSGFMIGIEFIGENGEPDGEACSEVLDYCFREGLILVNCGLERNVVRFIPPLITSEEQMSKSLDIFERGVGSTR